MAKVAAPGPTGTTDSILRMLLDDEICCLSLSHMMTDLINGSLSKEVMKRLLRARIVAIPKPDQGVRPVAVGEVWLKLAEIVLLQRHEKKLTPLFVPLQYGVMIKSGCEKVVHELAERYSEGCAILSIDLQNAFNSPSRDDIARAVFGQCTLRPFQRLFYAEYGTPSELLYYGRDGELFDVLSSSAGVRQGSPLSTILFCAFLQPVLETIKAEYPQMHVYAFIDDRNFASKDTVLLTSAFARLKELLQQRLIELSPTKCLWLEGTNHICIPNELREQGIKTESHAMKVLGAYVGDATEVKGQLLLKLKKHRTAFRRLEQMGASNISLLLLSN